MPQNVEVSGQAKVEQEFKVCKIGLVLVKLLHISGWTKHYD